MKSVCIITNEIFGPHKNGGIGTSQTFLALLLAQNNYNVTIIYTGSIEHLNVGHWEKWYASASIRFVHFQNSRRRIYPSFFEKSHNLVEFFHNESFDVVILQDWGGDGYGLTAAKRCGYLSSTTFVMWLHSPNVWCMHANEERSGDIDLLYRNEMERAAVENADVIWAPSQYMIDWLCDRGWNIRDRAIVRKLFIPSVSLSEKQPPSTLDTTAVEIKIRKKVLNTLVFFGRLERRKGIEVFCKAINMSSDIQSKIKKIIFIGKPANWSVDEIKMQLQAVRSGIKIEFFTDLNSPDALDLVRRTDGLVVMPSLADNSPCVVYECLQSQIQFISSTNGGMSELIHIDDVPLHVSSPRPDKLAELIRLHLNATRRYIAKSSFNFQDLREEYLQAFADLPSSNSGISLKCADPSLVTVVITHYERPILLIRLLDEFAKQSVSGFKVIVVDDCSRSDAARLVLNQIKKGTYPFSLFVIEKSENAYLGAARNTGLASVETPYVIFFDDDNLPFVTFVEEYLNAITRSDADTVTSLMVGFEGMQPPMEDIYSQPHWGFVPFTMSVSIWMNNFGDAAAIYRADKVRAVGGFHERYGITHEDWGLHLKMSQAGHRKAYIPRPLFWYRGSADSMSRTTNKYANAQVQIDQWMELLPASGSAVVQFILGLGEAIPARAREIHEMRIALENQRITFENGETSARAQLRRLSSILGSSEQVKSSSS